MQILEITKQLVFDALEQEDKAAVEALQESMNVVEQVRGAHICTYPAFYILVCCWSDRM